MKLLKKIYWSALLFLLAFSLLGSFAFNVKAQEELVYIIPVEKEVEKGLYAFLSRGIEEAKEAGADVIVFHVDTPGGAVDAAGSIGKLIDNTEIKTVAFVDNRALSAGAYISLHADEIYMVPNATMGAAAIIDQAGNAAGEKAESYWLAAMKSAAETSGRDPKYAMAMADKSIDLPEVGAGKGELLTLDAKTAETVGYSEGTVSSMEELLDVIGMENAEVENVEETFAEKLARFITNPVVVPILLSLASLGLVIELYSPGFGVAGSIGLASLLLFFYGHLVAGLAGYETLILLIIGIGLIISEFFLPGGIAGILGIGAVIGSILMAGGNIVYMGISILIALLVAVIAMVVFVKVLRKKMKFFDKIILRDSTNTESGYVSNVNRLELIGAEGVTKTPLRPAGTILIDGERIDAVTEGSFIAHNKPVKVVKVEGSRTVVREIE